MIELIKLLPLKMIMLATLANLMATSTGLSLMAVSAWLITTAAFHPALSTLAVGITIVRASGIFRAVFKYADRLLTHTAIFSMLTELRIKIYKSAIMRLPLKSGVIGEGELLHDLTVSCDVLKDLFPRVVQPLLCAAIISVTVTIFLAQVIYVYAMILPLSMTILVLLSYVFNVNEANDSEYRDIMLDMYTGRDEILVSKSVDIVVNKINAESHNFNINSQVNRNKIANIDSVCSAITVTALIIILIELAGKVNIVDLAVWLFILLSTFDTFNALPESMRHLHKIFFKTRKIKKTPTATTNENHYHSAEIFKYIIKADMVRFDYIYGISVLKDVSFNVRRGDKVAIVGESGSGKTTLLYLMIGLWQPDEGSITINGTVSAATTNNYIFSESIRKNFEMMSPGISQDEIYDVLSECQLNGFDIDAYIGENGARLSGGERCRLQTAIAMAVSSDILILDEPTAGLDRVTTNKLMARVIDDCNKKHRTLIVITHDEEVASMMDYVYSLD